MPSTLEFVITTFVTFFVVIDPLGILPIFMALTGKKSVAIRQQIAVRAVLLAGPILIVFAFAGDTVFRFLGISLPAFRIAGVPADYGLQPRPKKTRQSKARTWRVFHLQYRSAGPDRKSVV